MAINQGYEDVVSSGKPAGTIIIDGHETAETMQCVHCGRHWIRRRNSGKMMGYCMNCGGVFCPDSKCRECLHFKKKLELYEQGKLSELK
jgi:hypothetical protein